MADALEPCGFGGETCCCMEIPDCALDAGELVHVWMASSAVGLVVERESLR